jgi:hypothetical protein
MTSSTAFKLGQIAGALLMAAGVAAWQLRADHVSLYFILGAALYAGCRLAAWLKSS